MEWNLLENTIYMRVLVSETKLDVSKREDTEL